MAKRPTSNYVIYVIMLFHHYGSKVSGTDSLNCDFDHGLCNWKHGYGQFKWTWAKGETPTPDTGPDADHTSGEGAYVYIDTSSSKAGPRTKATLKSPKQIPGKYCFSLWYYMYGNHVDRLAVWRRENRNSLLFYIIRNQGMGWKFKSKEFNTPANFTISIEGRVKSSSSKDLGDIAVDDVKMRSGACSKPGCSNPIPTYGVADATDFSIGSVVNIECEDGYKITGISRVTCLDSGKWSDRPECNLIDCGTRNITNGQFTAISGTTFGQTAKQSCDSGYKLEGYETVMCAKSGWNGTEALCTIVDCSDPTPSSGIANSTNFQYKSVLEIKCDKGYKIIGNSSIVCLANGNWSGNPTCDLIDCSDPTPSSGIASSTNFQYRSVVEIKCDEGYKIMGNSSIVCRANGNWSSSHSCELIDCSDPTPSSGIANSTNFQYRSVVEIKCEKGYKIMGNSLIVCLANGYWSSSPTCDIESDSTSLDCDFDHGLCNWKHGYGQFKWTWAKGETPTPDTGPDADHTSGEGAYVYIDTSSKKAGPKTKATLKSPKQIPGKYCFSLWYYMYGSHVDRLAVWRHEKRNSLLFYIMRNQGMGWKFKSKEFNTPVNFTISIEGRVKRSSSKHLGDIAVDDVEMRSGACSKPGCSNPIPTYGVADATDFSIGSVVNIECEDGYKITGRSQVTCLESGKWSDRPECYLIDCGTRNITNGQFTAISGTTFGQTAKQSCDSGYKLEGYETVMCAKSGWNGTEALCTIVDCSDPTPSSGIANSTNFQYKSVLEIKCDKGYKIIGNSSIVCLANGNWSSNPTCDLIDCSDPTPSSGVANSTNFQYRSVVEIKCDEGYKIMGNSSIVCRANGTWSSSPTCELIDCSDPTPSSGIANSTNFQYRSVVEINCEKGYKIMGNSSIVCLVNGYWSSSPTCELIDCSDPTPSSGIANSTNFQYKSVLEIKCDKGYKIIGNSSIVCLANGNWSSNPTCDLIDCSDPTPSSGVANSTNFQYRSVVEIKCDEGYKIMGNSSIVCRANGTWSSSPTCELIDCSDPTPSSGIANSTNFQYRSVVEINCEKGYKIMGNSSIVCLVNGYWSSSPTCELIDCSDPTPSSGIANSTNFQYKSVLEIKCDKGYKIIGNSSIVCLANGNWSGNPTCDLIDCSDPTPSSGVANFTNFQYRSVVEIKCDKGYKIMGNSSIVCRANGTWSSSPTCELIDCSDPTPSSGIVNSTNFQYRSVVEIKCDEGYKIIGNSLIVCLANGYWSSSPTCELIESDTTSLDCDFDHGLCNWKHGYGQFKWTWAKGETPTPDTGPDADHTSGEGAYVYIDTSSTKARPKTKATLKSPKQIAGTYCFSLWYYMYGSHVDRLAVWRHQNRNSLLFFIVRNQGMGWKFKSKEFYTSANFTISIEGRVTRSSSKDLGDIAVDDVEMRSGACSKPGCNNPIPTYGVADATDFSIGSVVNIECEDGYKITGRSQVTCLKSGKWSDRPECNLIDCGTRNITNGQFTPISGTTFGQTAKQSCDSGYKLEGYETVMCAKSGWNSTEALCTIVDCSDPTPSSGIANSTNFQYKSVLEIKCDKGYKIKGNSSIVCLANGNWSSNPTCDLIDCSNPTPSSGVANSTNFQYRSVVEIKCDKGYKIMGNSSIVCRANGTWSSSPTCELIDCSDPTPSSGIANSTNFQYRSVVEIKCEKGYKIIGNSLIVCLANGYWSSSPTCELIESDTTSLDCDFDHGLCNWKHGYGQFKWTWAKGETPTPDTGPDADHTSGEGAYVYIDTSSTKARPKTKATLKSPKQIAGTYCFSLWYYMYGSHVDRLAVWRHQNRNSLLFFIVRNQGMGWKFKSKEFYTSANFTISIEGRVTRSSSKDLGDIAVDDVEMRSGACSKPGCSNPIPTYGVADATDFSIGSVVNIECEDGYKITGRSQVTCLESGKWSDRPQCNLIDCGTRNITNGQFTAISGTTFGQTAKQYCDSGYKLKGYETVMCAESGWNGTEAQCTIVDCNDPTPSLGIANSTHFLYRSVVEINCEKGYRIMGNSSIVCLANGNWSSNPTCELIDCSDPTPSSGISNSTNFKYRSVVEIECEKGYRIVGNSSIVCLANGNWNSNPTCELIDCSDPTPSSGISNSTNFKYRSVVEIECEKGYKIMGNSSIVCLANGNWSSNPTCELKDCSDPTPSSGISNSTNFKYRSVVEIECEKGYRIMGNSSIVCLANGNWNSNPTCELIDCSDPTPSSGISNSTNFKYRSVVEIECEKGYRIMGNSSIVCLANGNWNSNPTCELIDCKDPTPSSGISNSTYFKYRSVVEIECEKGYKIIGNSSIVCLANGNWSNNPTCELLDCSDPTPSSGISNSTHFKYRSVVEIKCEKGYKIIGNSSIVCLANGNWSNNPTCELIDCSDPTPSSGISNSTNFKYRSVVEIKCEKGYNIMGNSFIVCLANGNWSSNPICEQIGTFLESTINPCFHGGTYNETTKSCQCAAGYTGSTCKVLQCPKDTDEYGIAWESGIPGTHMPGSCPYGYSSGMVKRFCDYNGKYHDPVYNCTRPVIENIYRQFIHGYVYINETETVNILDGLVNATSVNNATTDTLMIGDLEAISSIMTKITEVVAVNSTDVSKLTDSFVEVANNMLGEVSKVSWKALINETGSGADTVIDALDIFIEKIALTKEANFSTIRFAKSNLLVEVDKSDKCEKKIHFPDEHHGNIPAWAHSNFLDIACSQIVEVDKSAICQNKSLFPDRQQGDIPALANSTSIDIACIQHKDGSAYSTVMYRDVSDIMPHRASENKIERYIHAPVMSLTRYPRITRKLESPVEVTFKLFDSTMENPSCSYWKRNTNDNVSSWSVDGCWLFEYDKKKNKVVCHCDHLTNFAVLLTPVSTIAESHAVILSNMSMMGCITSIICLSLTLFIHAIFWKCIESKTAVLNINLTAALLVAYVLLLKGIDKTENKELCTAIAVLLHLVYLIAFFILLADGISMAYCVYKPLSTYNPVIPLLITSYALPCVIIGASMGIVQLEGYRNNKFCWLSIDSGLIWAFVGPVLTIFSVNLIIIGYVIRVLCGTVTVSRKTVSERAKAGIRSILVLMPVMGATWIFGVFSVNEDKILFQYLFASFNSLQGVFIFVFFCVMNRKAPKPSQSAAIEASSSSNSEYFDAAQPRTEPQPSASSSANTEDFMDIG